VLLVCTGYSVLYSEIALSRKPFGVEHMYIYTLLLRMTDALISQNIDFSTWDTLYIQVYIKFFVSVKNITAIRRFRVTIAMNCGYIYGLQ
jgi:hypothetical protein